MTDASFIRVLAMVFSFSKGIGLCGYFSATPLTPLLVLALSSSSLKAVQKRLMRLVLQGSFPPKSVANMANSIAGPI